MPPASSTATANPPAAGRRSFSVFYGAIYLLFFISGMTGLVYEITWTRMFVFVFGNTTYAVSAVLSAFMAGLALGSVLFGHFVDTRNNALKIYALLELGIGLSALGVPLALQALDVLYALIYQQLSASVWALTAIRTVLSLALLLIPTSLMGATLPVLSKFVVERTGQVPQRVGLLYALNTLGAALGCFATGLFLLEYLGVQGSSNLAVAGNFALAFAFALCARVEKPAAPGRTATPEVPAEKAGPVFDRRYLNLILAAAALAGFTSLGYEVLWTRLLVFKLKTTTYAFTIMLTTFLAGIGLGSALLAGLERGFGTGSYPRVFGFIQAVIGLCGLASILLFGEIDRLFGSWALTWSGRVIEQMLVAGLIMFIPTLLMGAAFPVVSRIYTRHVRKVGASIGDVYSINTLGSVLGASITGFFLVRMLGTQNSLILMALLNLLIATAVLSFDPHHMQVKRRIRPFAPVLLFWIVAILTTVAIPRDLLFQFYNSGEKELDSQVEILHAVEGIGGVTTIHQLPNGERVISAGSVNVAGTSLTLRSTQKLQAHIPMLVHPGPEEVLQIGFGSGETAHILTSYPIRRLDVAEISQGVVDAASMYFRDINQNVTADPKFKVFVMDGANYLRVTDRRYDVIMNDSIWPFYAGNSGLYTREHFLAGREHLRPGGLMTSWLPLAMRLESFKTILKTFHSVFPHFSVWVNTTHYNKHALLIGSVEPLQIDVVEYLKRFDSYAREDLAAVDLPDPVLLLDCFTADEKTLSGELGDVPIHTVDRPILDFVPSKPVYKSQLAIYEMLVRQRTPIVHHLRNAEGLGARRHVFEEEWRKTHRASGHVLKGMIMREQRQPGFEREFEQAMQLRPDHPGVKYSRSYGDLLRTLDLGAVEGRSYSELIGLADRLAKARLHDKAAVVLQAAIKLDPDRPETYNELGLVLAQTGRLDAAIPHFEQAIALQPDYADAYNNLGNVLRRQNRPDEAAVKYRQALRFNPALPEVHYNLGMLLQAQGQTAEAIHELEEALALRPDYVKAHINLGVLLDSEGRLDEAIGHFQQAVGLAPDDEASRNNLVIGLVRAGRLDEATEHFDEGVRRQVALPVARRTLVMALSTQARSHAEKGEWPKAVARQRQAVELTPPKLRPPLLEQLRSYELRM